MPRATRTTRSSSVKSAPRSKVVTKKVISKRASAAPKKSAASSKALKASASSKATKKAPVRPKKSAVTREDRA